MTATIELVEKAPDVVAAAFKHDEDGHVLFGFCGRSAEPMPIDAAINSPLIIHDYLMERGVKYSVRLVPLRTGTALEIAGVSIDREEEVLWFARKHVVGCGLQLAESI